MFQSPAALSPRKFAAAAMDTLARCPQLIDPQIAFLSWLLLRRPRVQAVSGLKNARKFVKGGAGVARPVILLACVDVNAGFMHDKLSVLRAMACAAGVPVVHSMTRRHLGQALGLGFSVSVVCVMSVPDDRETRLLLRRVMALADRAYSKFQELLLCVYSVGFEGQAGFVGDTGTVIAGDDDAGDDDAGADYAGDVKLLMPMPVKPATALPGLLNSLLA